MSMVGDYMSMAEACGEREHVRAWVPGIDFDPYDTEEMEVMRLVWDTERYDRIRRLESESAHLERENARLHQEIEDLKQP